MKPGAAYRLWFLLASLSVAPVALGDAAIEGTLQILVGDDFASGTSRTAYVLEGADGRRTELTFPSGPPADLRTGDRLRLEGLPEPGGFTVTHTERLGPAPAEAPAPQAVSRVLVILLNFLDDTSQPYTPAQATTTMFGASGSVAAFYAEGSWGASTLTGDVIGWYTATINKPTTCDYSAVQTQAESAASAHVDPSQYGYHVYVFPTIGACGWAGLGMVGGSGAWINQSLSTYVTGHELGHNFGLLHAHSLACGAVPIAPSASCSRSEYGDPFDIMGGSSRQFSAYHKSVLGWLPASSIAVHASGTATYQIAPMETSSGLRAVKILAGGGRTYWLELRQATGCDAGLSGTVLNGALVRLAPSSVGGTDLLDMTPPSNMGDAALAVPNTFTDADSGLTVTSVAKSGSLLTLNVSLLAPRRLYTLTPCRLADTRNAAGSWGGPALSAGQARTFTAWYRCGVPSTARGLAMNVSVTAPAAPGFLSLYAAGATAPPTSALNFSAGQTRTNNAYVSLGGSGDLTVQLGCAGPAHVILDVVGYWE